MGPLNKSGIKTYGAAPKAEAKAKKRKKRQALKTIQLKAKISKENPNVDSPPSSRWSKNPVILEQKSSRDTAMQIPFWETNKTKWDYSECLSSIDCETTFDKLLGKNGAKKKVSLSKTTPSCSNCEEHEQSSINQAFNEAREPSDFSSFCDQTKATPSSYMCNVTNRLSSFVIERDVFTNQTSTPRHLRKRVLVLDSSKLCLTLSPSCSPIDKRSSSSCTSRSSVHRRSHSCITKRHPKKNISNQSMRSPDPFRSISFDQRSTENLYLIFNPHHSFNSNDNGLATDNSKEVTNPVPTSKKLDESFQSKRYLRSVSISQSIKNLHLSPNPHHSFNSNDNGLATDNSKEVTNPVTTSKKLDESFPSKRNCTNSYIKNASEENRVTSIIEDTNMYDSIKLSVRRRQELFEVVNSINNCPLKKELNNSVRFSHRSSLKNPRKSVIHRRQTHQVVFDKLATQPESTYFRDFHCGVNDAILDEPEETVNNKSAEVLATTCNASYCSDISPTGRDVVLQKCNQDGPIPFIEAYPETYLDKCHKIGEGLYGEVFKHVDGARSSVIKIIPVDGEELVNGERQKKFHEILSEIVIAKELSDLRCCSDDVKTSGFVKVIQNYCLRGQYPKKLIELWNEFAEECGTDNDSPTMFNESQLYIVLELADGGTEMEKFVFTNSKQALSVLLQTAYALAAAEQRMEFEHRDLHWGNVLVSSTKDKKETFLLNGKIRSVPTQGVQVSIIDFTLSRMTYEGCCIFNDLSVDDGLFASVGDYQFDMYRMMKENCNNDWSKFVPRNNVIWLHYLVDKMVDVNGVHYKNTKTKVHETGRAKLVELKNTLLLYKSTFDFVSNL